MNKEVVFVKNVEGFDDMVDMVELVLSYRGCKVDYIGFSNGYYFWLLIEGVVDVFDKVFNEMGLIWGMRC